LLHESYIISYGWIKIIRNKLIQITPNLEQSFTSRGFVYISQMNVI